MSSPKATRFNRNQEYLDLDDKEVLRSYMRDNERILAYKKFIDSHGDKSVMLLLVSELNARVADLIPAIDDYYLRTRTYSYQHSVREYITLFASHLLVARRLVDINKGKYKSLIVNTQNLHTCGFIIPFN